MSEPTKASIHAIAMSKWRAAFSLQISEGGTYLRPSRHPAYSGHELGPGSGTERENPVGDAK